LKAPYLQINVIAGELEGSWRAGGQQEGLQYNGEAAQQVIVIYIVSADVIAGGAGGQQEGLQYNGEAAW
jgi:hypothetical protein